MYLCSWVRLTKIGRYSAGVTLAGVIYVHRISDDRFGGVATKNFRMFRKLCGEKTLKNVVLMTNMWGRVTPQQGENREQQLKDDFFKAAIEKGAQLCRHTNTLESARAVLRMILKNEPAVLDIQRELIDEHKDIRQTGAGEELNGEICRTVVKYGNDIRELEEEMKRAAEEGDEESQEELEEERRRLESKIEELQKLMEGMKSMFEGAQREMKERFEERSRRMQEEFAERSRRMQEESEGRSRRMQEEFEERSRLMQEESEERSRLMQEGFKEQLRQMQEEHRAESQRYSKEEHHHHHHQGGGCIVM